MILHEVIHGLGFQTLVDLQTGDKGGTQNWNDAYMVHLEDHSIDKNWGDTSPPPQAMSDAERVTSATDTGDLHWTGANVTTNSGGLSGGIAQGHVQMHAPSSLSLGSSVSHFATNATPNELMEPILNGAFDGIGLARYLLEDIGWDIFNSK